MASSCLNGWSLGDAQPFFTPERLDDVDAAQPSGVTTIDGVGLGDPVTDIQNEQLVEAATGRHVVPGARVVFVETDEEGGITGFESSRNDCIGLDVSAIPCGRPIPVFTLPCDVPTGEPDIDGNMVVWSAAANATSDAQVTEILGGANDIDDDLLRNAAMAPINARNGPVDVRLVPVGDPGVGGASIHVFDDRTPRVRLLVLDPGLDTGEWQVDVTNLAAQLSPQL